MWCKEKRAWTFREHSRENHETESAQAQGSAFVIVASSDIDGGVGIEVLLDYSLSGTIGTGTPPITFSLQAVSATFEFRGVTVGATTLSLGAVSAPSIQAATYQPSMPPYAEESGDS